MLKKLLRGLLGLPEKTEESISSEAPSGASRGMGRFESRKSVDEDLGDGYWVIDGEFMQVSSSPDSSFRFAWRSGNESIPGEVLIQKEGRTIFRCAAERPNDGVVASNGTSVFCDCLFGDGLKGAFVAMSPSGEVLMHRRFKANLLNCAVSPDGRFAVSQTCNADGSDGNALVFYDLANRREVWKTAPVCGWAKTYEFDAERRYLWLIDNDGRRFRYSFDGEFLDHDALEQHRIETGNGFAVWEIMGARKAAGTAGQGEILSLIDTAIARFGEYPNWAAKAYRLRGELLEDLGQVADALESYERAIALNPKVGLKRKVDTLRKAHGARDPLK